ncbi:hypothetical protein NE237_030036 [Protea cynaroides]|uniref:Uncharacterized protein n=1 Tax=Protea cynaroides TaxID=273540 RepID=A0A9Q0GTB0_9MAGN|nr:hypothetical protein NE237_030036 [Protea cynaroides]
MGSMDGPTPTTENGRMARTNTTCNGNKQQQKTKTDYGFDLSVVAADKEYEAFRKEKARTSSSGGGNARRASLERQKASPCQGHRTSENAVRWTQRLRILRPLH